MQKQLLEIENNLGGFTMKKFLKQLFKKRLNNEKGLTLIELLAVIVILAIVAAIAVPAIGNIINNSEIKAVKADALNILNAANIYVTENPSVTSIVYDKDATSEAARFTENGTGSLENFDGFVQSLGAFNEVDFTIFNDGGTVGIYATGISAGGQSITFGTSNDAAGSAKIDDIDAGSADEEDKVVFSD